MIYLLLSISCSVSMALLLKYSQSQGMNSRALITANYMAGAVVGWSLVVVNGGTSFSSSTILFGLGGGLIWPLPFFILLRTIRELGVAIAAPLARFGLIVPVLFGLLFLGEELSAIGLFGLLGALVAIVLLSPVGGKDKARINRHSLGLIAVMILMIGLANLWINLFNTYGNTGETNLFFTLIFTFASFVCLIVMRRGSIMIDRPTALRGVLVGGVNFFYTYFLLATLRAPLFIDNSAIVYITTNVVYMVLVFAAGALIWRESVSAKNAWGVAVAAASLLMLNIR